ncbi:MAG: hypothetical protein AB197_00210 [Parcubacteria bacterium C7867-002]|nr:MAG: hypothetical protein AB197_00210 [Parcubacteria bacterium C7867-002]
MNSVKIFTPRNIKIILFITFVPLILSTFVPGEFGLIPLIGDVYALITGFYIVPLSPLAKVMHINLFAPTEYGTLHWTAFGASIAIVFWFIVSSLIVTFITRSQFTFDHLSPEQKELARQRSKRNVRYLKYFILIFALILAIILYFLV